MSNTAKTRSRRTDRTARRTERREALLETAIACIRREGPDASMDEIAAEAGVTKPIVYRYFRHKADLYDAIAVRYTESVAADVRKALRRKDPRESLRAGIDAYIRLVDRDTEIYRFLMQRARLSRVSDDGPVENFMRRLGDEIGLVLGERLRQLGLDSGPAEVWGHAIVGTVSASVDWWVERRVLPRRRLVQYLTDLLWTGMSRGVSLDLDVRTAVSEPEERESGADVVPLRRRR